MIVEAVQYNATTLSHYIVHAFVIMPDHIHLLATPAVALPTLMKSLNSITAKRANAMLALTGKLSGRKRVMTTRFEMRGNFRGSGNTLNRIQFGRG
jgi:REP element-mobilizing transposase RayT